MSNTNNNVSRDVLKKVEAVYNKALRKGDKVLLGLLGPAYKQIKGAANLITPDAKEVYSASKKVIKNPNVANVTNLGITLGTEVLPTAAATKSLIRSSRRGNQPMSKGKVVKNIVEEVTGKSKKSRKTTGAGSTVRAGRIRRNKVDKVPKGESQLSHMKKDVEAAAEKRAKAAAEKRAKAAAEKRAKAAAAAAAAKKRATEKTKNNKTKSFPLGRIGGGIAVIGGLASQKSQQSKKLPEKEVGSPPKVTALKPEGPKKKKVDSTPAPTGKKTGSEYKAYPGAAGRAGFEYGRDITEVLDDKTVSDEIKERIEEEELYEGDFKGGRVGKGKKKRVSQAPRGVRAALRGFKPKMGVSKENKRTRGTGGGWV